MTLGKEWVLDDVVYTPPTNFFKFKFFFSEFQKAQIQGRMSEMENQMKMIEKELLGKTLRNIDENYNNENLKFEV